MDDLKPQDIANINATIDQLSDQEYNKFQHCIQTLLSLEENDLESICDESLAFIFRHEKYINGVTSAKLFAVIENLTKYAIAHLAKLDYFPILEQLCDFFDSSNRYNHKDRMQIHKDMALLYLHVDDEKTAYEHLKKATYNQFIDYKSYDGFEFYSFRDFTKYAFADIINNTLTITHPSLFNDPLDAVLFRHNQYLIANASDDYQKSLQMLLQKTYEHFKVRCFVSLQELPRDVSQPFSRQPHHIEEVNSLLWAHYARDHKGFCIKYKFPKTFVKNENEDQLTLTRIGSVTYEPEMKFEGRQLSAFEALFSKHNIWSYESEARLVYYDPNNREDYQILPLPEDSITEIYLGLRCCDADRDRMKKILRNRNIKLYQMVLDEYDVYKLRSQRIM